MRIAFVGDVMLGRLVNKMLNIRDAAYPWGNTLPLLQQADLRICNLECVLSNVGEPWSATPKMFHFRSDEKNVSVLEAAQMDILSIANNHVLDYGDEALLRMQEVLDSRKILYAGAGKNWLQASQPVVFQDKKEKIGFLAFTDNEPGWEAQENQPGIYYIPPNLKDKRAQNLLKKVQKLRSTVDFLIISAHWGPNWGYEPPKEHVVFAHALIDGGADLIFGHSGHVFRGIEIYKKRPIIYCAGDFIDDYAVDKIEKNDESFVFLVDITEEKFNIYLYPTIIQDFQAKRAEYYRKDSILLKMKNLCEDLGTFIQLFSDYAIIEI